MKRFNLFCTILLAGALIQVLPAQQQQQLKKPFAISDLYSIKGVSDPHLSPDGKRIVFTVTESMLKDGKTNAEIYLINSDGSGLKRLTNNPASDNTPRWSPDGKSILFVSTRTNGPQAWLLPADGGEPSKLTDLSTGIADPVCTSDGSGFVFTSDVYPEFGADDAQNKKVNDAKSQGAIQAHMTDHLMYRHWTEWKDGTRTHTFFFNLRTKQHTDLSPGDFDAPAFSLGESGYALSPDGKEVCFVSNHDANEAETTNKDLFVVPSTGGSAKNITSTNRAYDGTPEYSPDGRYIAYRTQSTPGYEADCFRIALYDRATGATSVLTESFDNWINDFRWSPDSKTIYFSAQVKAHTPLYSLDIKSKQISLVYDAKTIDAFDVSSDGTFLVFARRSINEPVELCRVSVKGKEFKRLTFFNKPIEDSVDIRPAQEVWITSPAGRSIHTFIITPHGFDPSKKYPLILNVHGGPQSQWADGFRGDWQVYPGSGYIVAFCNPTGSTGYGQRFTADISKDWAGAVYTDVMAVADSLATIPYVDKNRMGAMGWSYGGYFMMWLEGHTTRFKAIASMMGVYDLKAMHGTTEELWFPQWDLGGRPGESDLYEKLSPNKYVKNFTTPCLVITGERDYRVSYNQSLEFFTDLQQMQVPSRLIVFPNDGHWPSAVKSMPLYYNAHLDWFHRYLGGDAAPYDMTKMVRNQAFE
ncbi:MAG TPA: S9 family peptidase [Bacteroidota bacterium]|nr:S9 family peptidase [Bacteroidota bacterium]